MTYDLRYAPWIPWRRRSGLVDWGAIASLVDHIDADPVVGIAAPRPDFDGALHEFLIGILTAALRPADEKEWRDRWKAPPSVEELRAALDALPAAFDLDGDGPRFFQDLDAVALARTELTPVDRLLIDSPGEQSAQLNKDLFVKRDRATCMSRPAAAMALLTLQTYAPAGGKGYRTSLRGGGPLTTLIDPRVGSDGGWRAGDPLWQLLWANVQTTAQLEARMVSGSGPMAARVFPWLAPTRTSNTREGGVSTTPADGDPLQAYFGLPRRIRLEFGGAGTCEVTGLHDEVTVVGFRTLNYGVQYEGWRHPLSPYYRTKPTEPWLPVHGQPGGIVWRDWLALTLEAPAGESRTPAAAVAQFARRGSSIGRPEVRLRAFGYDMDNMKARGWTDATVPAVAIDDDNQRALLYARVRSLTEATSLTAVALLGAVKDAFFESPENAGGDLGQVRQELWAATEQPFYEVVRAIASSSLELDHTIELAAARLRGFIAPLTSAATGIFDRWCPPGALSPEALRRRVAARYALVSTLGGYSKLGESVFTELGIAPPGGGREARKSKRTRGKEKAR